jgi:hypothetical protein
MSREQQNLDAFKKLIVVCMESEKNKINILKDSNKVIVDKDLNNHITRREQFFSFCVGSKEHIDKISSYLGNEQYLDKVQKDFYLSIDSLKKEALKLMAKNQKQWFNKLFDNDFEKLKLLLRSLLTFEAEHEKTQIERIVQEIELIKYNK